MIVDTDRVEIPTGVSIGVGCLEDIVRGRGWPLNNAGGFVLERVGTPLDVVARELAAACCIPTDVARHDVMQFIWALNALALVNIVHRGSRLRRWTDWLVLAARLIPAAALPAPVTRRRALDTETVSRAFASVLRASGSRVLSISSVSAIALLPLVASLGGRGSAFVVAVGLGVGTGLGVGLHEVGHAITLRGVPSALVLRGRRTFVLHGAVGEVRRSLVAVAGPGLAAAVGLVPVVAGNLLVSPLLVTLGLPFVAHAVSLSALGGDGRSACGI